jgi:hypothetical protein
MDTIGYRALGGGAARDAKLGSRPHERHGHHDLAGSYGARGVRGQAATGNNKLILVSFFYSDRADLDEFMLVMVVTPVASLTVPVAVMFMMPVLVIPVVIAAILISHGCQRHSSDGSKHCKS